MAVQVACVQHSSTLHDSPARPEVCYGTFKSTDNWSLCRFMPVLHKKRQAACGVCYVRGTAVPQCCIPHSPPKATAKLSTEQRERVGQNQNSPSAGDGYRATSKSSPNRNSCCSSCLPGHHRHKQNSRELGRLSVPALSCALFPTAPEHSLAASVLPWGIAGAVWSGWQMPRRITSCREYEFYGLAALYYRSVN